MVGIALSVIIGGLLGYFFQYLFLQRKEVNKVQA